MAWGQPLLALVYRNSRLCSMEAPMPQWRWHIVGLIHYNEQGGVLVSRGAVCHSTSRKLSCTRCRARSTASTRARTTCPTATTVLGSRTK